MMFERFTVDARTVVVHAQEHARRLGHRYVGCEHFLLAVVSAGEPVGAVLREQGISSGMASVTRCRTVSSAITVVRRGSRSVGYLGSRWAIRSAARRAPWLGTARYRVLRPMARCRVAARSAGVVVE